MKLNLKFWIFTLSIILIIIISGCVSKESSTETQVSEEKSIQDLGDFKVVYTSTQNQYYNELQQVLQESTAFENITDGLNSFLALPDDIDINFTECGVTNAFYDPETRQIVMCYELIEYFSQLFNYLESQDELWNATWDATFFVFYHEMGHSLVGVLSLPITGKEEDAVDQLATLVLIGSGELGERAAINGANWFLLQGSQHTDIEQLAFWDEHSLDLQRFYNIACWVYGQNPEKYSYLVEGGWLPEDRALKCGYEYEQMYKSWNALLSPYYK